MTCTCAGRNPVKLWKYKQYPFSKWKNEIEWNWNTAGENELLQKFW